ncbi:uncharacterized protein N7483_005415 [Penicillium malachiteum]|uniref:uncharacterized protein n=1 Tax=Penicillium malachiteum TaxID=1324776 RepID=UPI0025482DF9|nr:uncharacterized protein N7483_005415 [Penicillium malachiteum]KAJ5730907.1 hypothetical protein N7483_005415 [Penicillium malachiteum]
MLSAESSAPIRVLYRPGSDISNVPSHVEKVEVDLEDQDAVRKSLQDIDILISLVGQSGVKLQHAFVEALPHTSVKLFVPSNLAFRCDEQGLRVPVNREKNKVEKAASAAGIPMTIVLPGLFAESALNAPLLGIDLIKNCVAFPGDGEHQKMNICTRQYIAASYASIFARTPVSELQGRVISLSEIQPTGTEIASALEARNGSSPQIFHHTLEQVDNHNQKTLDEGAPLTLVWYGRRVWGAGGYEAAIGNDIWEVEGYKKKTLNELFSNGGLEPYRDFPAELLELLEKTFY